MGQIYLARSTRAEGFSKLLVVKLLLAEHSRDPGFVAMFLDEARIAARLNHPNIGQIFDLGDVEGAYYLAMEYVPGVDLRTLEKDCQDRRRPLPLPLAARVFADAAAGLHYAHELTDDAGHALGVVHRDVSPSNLLVSFDGGVKLIDFGIAKAKGRSTATAAGQLKGKFAYMSPEQAEGDDLDRRSDLYSLGLVFHEVITGKRVLQRDSDTQTLKAAREGAVEPCSKLNPLVPASLDAVIGKALARKPEDRYATASEFGLAIEEWLLQSREPASTAHLSGFLKGLYPDHAERSRGPSTSTDDGLGSTVVRTPSGAPLLRTALTPSGAGQPMAPQVQLTPAPAVLPPTQPEAAHKRSRAVWVGVGVLGAAVALATGVFIAGPPGRDGGERPTPLPLGVKAALVPKAFRLSLTSVPAGATVKLDGVVLGQTPLDTDLPAGRKGELLVEGPGLVSRRLEVDMKADKQLELQLERAPVSFSVESQPPGATVRDGAEVLGTTPFTWKVAPDRRPLLVFELKGYQRAQAEVTPHEGEAVKVALKKSLKTGSPPPDNASPFTTKGNR
jgi:serine/threonine protein kinase